MTDSDTFARVEAATPAGAVIAPALPPMVSGVARPTKTHDRPTDHAPAPAEQVTEPVTNPVTEALTELFGDTAGEDYIPIGAFTVDDLMVNTPRDWETLDAQIVTVCNWVQGTLSERKLAGQIDVARTDPNVRRHLTNLVDQLALKYMVSQGIVASQDRPLVVAFVINEVLGLGPIEPLMHDPTITEVMINGPSNVVIEREGKRYKAPGCRFRDAEHLTEVCRRILLPLNKNLSARTPLVDARLADGSRVNIVHDSIAPAGPMVTIRRFPADTWTMEKLIDAGSVNEEMACLLAFLIKHKCSTLVIGGTGSGKTSLLNALSSCIPREERIVTIEDSLELRFHAGAHVVALEARPASANGENAVSTRDLVKNALRMAPMRIVVGEVRGPEALDMLQACNTGHEGSMSTVHANDPDAAVQRLEVLVATGGEIPDDKVGWLIGDAIDIIVWQSRYEDGSRRIAAVCEVPHMKPGDTRLTPIPLWEWEQTGYDQRGKLVGHYVKVNDISEGLRKRRRLDMFRKLTMNDVRELSAELN